MDLSQKLIGAFTRGSLAGLMLGAALWRSSDSGLKTQWEAASVFADGSLHNAKPKANGIKSLAEGPSGASKNERITRAKGAFQSLSKIGASCFSSTQGGPAFASAMQGISGFSSDEFATLLGELSLARLSSEEMVAPLLAWAVVDAKQALDFAIKDKQLQRTEKVLAMLVHELATTDLAAARSVVEKMELDEKTKCQAAMVVALFGTDRLAAARMATEFGDNKTTSGVFRLWAEEDPAAATAAFALGQPGQEETAWELAHSVLAKDPAGYTSWVDRLEGSIASAARARAVLNFIETDAASGAASLQRILNQDPSADKFCRDKNLPAAIVKQWWKSTQPQEIATWATSLAGSVQEQAVSNVAEVWTGKNSADASVWIISLPAGNARDAAVGHLINAIRDEFATDAIECAQSISNPEQPAKALKSIKPPTAN